MLEKGHCHLGQIVPVEPLLSHSAFYVALQVVGAHFQAYSATPGLSPEESGIIWIIKSIQLPAKIYLFLMLSTLQSYLFNLS